MQLRERVFGHITEAAIGSGEEGSRRANEVPAEEDSCREKHDNWKQERRGLDQGERK